MPSVITKISNVSLANVDSLSGVNKSNVDTLSGVVMSSGSGTLTTDKLLIWYDASLENIGSTTLSNRVDNTLTGAIVQDGHGAGRMGSASVQSISGTRAMYLDGTNDAFRKRAYFSALDGSGEGNHGTSTFGVLPNSSSITSNPSTQSLKNTGFTIEVWYRTNGSFTNNGNLWSMFSNNGIRTRFSSSGVRWFYTQGSGVMSSGWGTYSQDVWYHDVTTVGAPNASGSSLNRHTISLYVNGSLVQSLTNRSLNPSSYIRDFMLFGGSRTSGSNVLEDFRGYYGIVRVYHKALSSTEVTGNYNLEKSRYGY